VIGNYDSVESVNAAEVEAIRAYRLLGMADLNITDGGQGATGSKWTDARREKQMRSVSRGDQHVHRKLSSDIVREIRNLRSTVWVSSRVLAEKYGVSKSQITAILRNREWFDAEFNPESIVKPPRKGDNSYHKKLSWPEVREIRALALSQYISPYELAKQFNTSQPNIRDILNNKIWVDKAYNPREVIPRPASLKPRGGKQGKRLTPEQVVEIRHLFRAGWKLKELSARYGVVENSVSRIVNGVTWGHLREGLE
jgi:DNA-binding transcriptional regulator YiaG|tara:strand:+ start:12762 stop:13523 length:762 start_codon:yes stop_codon:yes gene_type:complete